MLHRIAVLLFACCCLPLHAAELPQPLFNSHEVALPDPRMGFSELQAAFLPDPLETKKIHVNLHKRWQYATHLQCDEANLKPFVTETTLYLAGKSGQVIAINRHTGQLQWHAHTHLPLSSGPHVAYGLMALGSHEGTLVILDLKTGVKRWERRLPDEILASPVITDQQIFVKTSNDALWSLDKKQGKTLWHHANEPQRLRLRGSSTPLVTRDAVFAGFSNGRLYAFDRTTGQVLWQRLIGSARGFSDVEQLVDINANLQHTQHTLFALSYQGTLTAVNDENGEVIWQYPLSGYQDMALAGTHLLVTDVQHELWAFAQDNGCVLWHESHLAKRKIGAPTVLDAVVWIGDQQGRLHARTLKNGHPLGHLRVSESPLRGAPLVRDNEIYTLSANGLLTAFRQL